METKRNKEKTEPMMPVYRKPPFWERKSLKDLTHDEWELLCDGCAKCCLEKTEDIETGEIRVIPVTCKYLDLEICRCTVYKIRTRVNGNCIQLTPDKVKQVKWLPHSCAYRTLAEGRDLAWWHPLVSGDPGTVRRAGISIRGRVVSGEFVHPEEINWALDIGNNPRPKIP